MKPTDCCCTPDPTPSKIYRGILLLLWVWLAYLLIGTDFSSMLQWTTITDNLWIVFLLGLVASISTCLAITWWVIIAYTDLTVDSEQTNKQLRMHQGVLHVGRVMWFVVFGGVLWLVWQQLSYSLGFTTWLNALVSIVLLIVWLQIIGLVPSGKLWWVWFDKIYNRIHNRGKSSRVTWVFGALTFFVPCGFTQMVQLMALSSWSRTTGAVIMGVFALGTLPWLLLLWVGTWYAKASHKQYFQRWVAVLLIAFSLYSLWWSFMLSGFWSEISTQEQMVWVEIETITLSHNGSTIVPEQVILEAWKSYEIVIVPTQDGVWCMTTLVFPSFNDTIYQVKQWEPITYVLENVVAWKYPLVCSTMGMSQWTILVQ
jgi:sulfite exporter TauE/SafE